MNRLIEKVLNEVSLDPRVKDGIFSIEDNTHMDVLREFFMAKGIDEEAVREYTNSVLEGKYPERQAYNQKGILVTFPTPEYKAKAIERGTHFEKDPTIGQSNLFGGQPQPPPTAPGAAPAPAGQQQAPQPPAAQAAPAAAPATNLPLSQAGGTEAPPAATPQGAGQPAPAPEPATTAAPISVPASTPEEPEVEPEEPVAPPPKSDAEKAVDKRTIKTMLKGDDYMLEEVYNILMEALELRPYTKDGRDFTLSVKAKRLMEYIKKKTV